MTKHHKIDPLESAPIECNTPSGWIEFFEFSYTPTHPGSRLNPPEAAEVSISEAWYAATGEALSDGALDALHDSDDAHAAIVAAVEGWLEDSTV